MGIVLTLGTGALTKDPATAGGLVDDVVIKRKNYFILSVPHELGSAAHNSVHVCSSRSTSNNN